MLININAAKCVGIEAVRVTVEVDVTSGIGIHLVGLADVAVKESLMRTMTALQAMGFRIPGRKIVINLAPADLHKNGSGYDLPIALGIIAASQQAEMPLLGRYLIMGELGLDGSLRYISGALPFAELAAGLGLKGCILPERSALEAASISGIDVYGAKNLADVLRVLCGGVPGYADDLLIRESELYRNSLAGEDGAGSGVMDFSEIVGQDAAKRGAEIAVAGGHNMILIGSPGSGKSSLAKAISGILPPMTPEESLLTSKIYSAAGKSSGAGLIRRRPFRAPHYSASLSSLIGGGSSAGISPGEVSLANGGVLFLDELAQMPKSLIEALRSPMEDRSVCISRLRTKIIYPASFMLVAATNPCPCGYYGEGDRCTCTVGQRTGYLSRLSGPIMDRIDIQLWMHPVEAAKLLSVAGGSARKTSAPGGRISPGTYRGESRPETSAEIAGRVRKARLIQRERFRDEGISTNAEMSNRHLERFCPLSEECRDILEKIITRMGLSARAFSRIIKVSRTIADLSGARDIQPEHIAEAASYRFLDRKNIGY